jgi:tetratricopeptide (TPR) repeat protein
MRHFNHVLWVSCVSVAVVLSLPALAAQRGGPMSDNLRQAMTWLRNGQTDQALEAVRREAQADPSSMGAGNLLDVLGATGEAKRVFQRAIDTASSPAARAAAQRAMAMSYAFDGDCASTVKFEEQVIAYWVTREQAEPQNAFYQEGEMANEGARVCIDSGDLDTAERMYRRGTELGLAEPGNRTHPRSLWAYRLAHALGRIAARRGDAAEAARQIGEARRALDGDPTMAQAQERFFPYLVGYVALYTGDLDTAERELTRAVGMGGNQSDPFMTTLLGMTFEKRGNAARARELYQRAYDLATAHNPPAAFARRVTREKLGLND